MKLSEISFPVYNLRHVTRTYEENKVLYAETIYDTYIIDNKNLRGDTLGERRLRVQGEKLYRLGEVVENLQQFKQISKKSDNFIDSTGKVFKYKKSRYCTVRTYEVVAVHPNKVVSLRGTSIPYKVKDVLAYVCLLHTSNQGRLVFETTDEHKEDYKIWI